MPDLVSISDREFELYALTLPSGPNFDDSRLLSTWRNDRHTGVGTTFWLPSSQSYGFLAMRRRVDHRLVQVANQTGFADHDAALAAMRNAMKPEETPEPIPSGERRRPLLSDLGNRTPSDTFKLLTGTVSHWPALRTVGEIYLAMPQPDDNFASDFQTTNFDARLWEMYLFACFREQGIIVSQDRPSPDFHLQLGADQLYVEAVTANPQGPRQPGLPLPQHAPQDREERLSGSAAVRFAKTLRSKLQRAYEKLPHVRGSPYALALADFHGPSSMVWSREALPTYLYGQLPVILDGPAEKSASMQRLGHLRDHPHIPAGLFSDESMKDLSAVIFSNAGTISKFNRMGFLAGFRLPGMTMRRAGILFDRRPGVLEPIDFDFDILSSDYAKLWPGGEAWCQELEVFHNPLASAPLSFDLIPGATHWFKRDGEVVCETIWKNFVLASITRVKAPSFP